MKPSVYKEGCEIDGSAETHPNQPTQTKPLQPINHLYQLYQHVL